MAEQEEPLLKRAEPEDEGEGDETPAEGGVQGPVLDVDLIISRLLSYKEKPGKQVQPFCCTSRRKFVQLLLLSLVTNR